MNYIVIRMDDNGNNFIVIDKLSFEAAHNALKRFSGHKQTYSIWKYNTKEERKDIINFLHIVE